MICDKYRGKNTGPQSVKLNGIIAVAAAGKCKHYNTLTVQDRV
jgi:hypothetical protein